MSKTQVTTGIFEAIRHGLILFPLTFHLTFINQSAIMKTFVSDNSYPLIDMILCRSLAVTGVRVTVFWPCWALTSARGKQEQDLGQP